MPTLHALCRAVSPAIADCELSFIGREAIDAQKAQAQHEDYVAVLRKLGVEVIELPADNELPDSVFVEDTVLLFDELAVMTRPGAISRRPELASIEVAFRPYRDIIARITEPGTLDGGDVLCIGNRVFVGLSQRSNQAAIDQLSACLMPFGYQVIAVPMQDCLHLKSSVTALSDDTVLINPAWVDATYFANYQHVVVDESEQHAANCVRVNEQILMPSCFPKTQAKIQSLGYSVHTVDVSELQKAEGAVTCCSVLFKS